jgi:hypothetical protein
VDHVGVVYFGYLVDNDILEFWLFVWNLLICISLTAEAVSSNVLSTNASDSRTVHNRYRGPHAEHKIRPAATKASIILANLRTLRKDTCSRSAGSYSLISQIRGSLGHSVRDVPSFRAEIQTKNIQEDAAYP